MNKKIILPGAAVIAFAGTLFLTSRYVTPAQAVSNQVPSIVQAIANRFNLNVNDVKAVFDQNRQNRMTQMETKYEAALAQDVTNGKITAAQETLILAKHKELLANRQHNRTDLQAWATQNGVDIKYLIGGFGMRGHMGMW